MDSEKIPINPQSLILAAHKQRKLTGNPDAIVTLVIRGKWPKNGKKKLDGKKGPYGQCVAEFETDVLCAFKASEVIAYCSRFLPVLTLQKLKRDGEDLDTDYVI